MSVGHIPVFISTSFKNSDSTSWNKLSPSDIKFLVYAWNNKTIILNVA